MQAKYDVMSFRQSFHVCFQGVETNLKMGRVCNGQRITSTFLLLVWTHRVWGSLNGTTYHLSGTPWKVLVQFPVCIITVCIMNSQYMNFHGSNDSMFNAQTDTEVLLDWSMYLKNDGFCHLCPRFGGYETMHQPASHGEFWPHIWSRGASIRLEVGNSRTFEKKQMVKNIFRTKCTIVLQNSIGHLPVWITSSRPSKRLVCDYWSKCHSASGLNLKCWTNNQASKQASKQTNKQANKQTNKTDLDVGARYINLFELCQKIFSQKIKFHFRWGGGWSMRRGGHCVQRQGRCVLFLKRNVFDR